MSHKIEEFMRKNPILKSLGVHPIAIAQKQGEEKQKIKKEMNQVLGKSDSFMCPTESEGFTGSQQRKREKK